MLRLTKQTDYGIVLLAFLARDPARRFAAPDLAEETGLPQPTVAKILKILARGHLLDSHRGAKGGYSLAVSPEDVSVARMIEVLDGPIAFTECVEDAPGECSQESSCQVRGSWQAINAAVRQALESVSLAQLASSSPVEPVMPRLVQLPTRGASRMPDSALTETPQ